MEIQSLSGPSLKIRQTSKYGMVIGINGNQKHFSNAQISRYGFVCDSIQSHTPIVSFSSSGQPSLCDRRLNHELNNPHSYAFPPTVMIPPILDKTRQSRCRIPLIARLWSQRPWFSEVLNLLVSVPIRLPYFPNLVTQAIWKFQQQNLPTLVLHAWDLSSNQIEIKHFHKTLQSLSQDQEEYLLRTSMMQNGSYIPIDVIERLIRSQPLLLS